MSVFGWDYPPGVTGNEFAIAGPDYERDVDGECGNGHRALEEQGYQGTRWLVCTLCDWQRDLPDLDELLEQTS